MKTIKEGDKIRIVCKDGDSNSASITHDGKELNYLTGCKIDISAGEQVKATLGMISPVIDAEATIIEIIDMNPKLEEIKRIINDMPDPDSDTDRISTLCKIMKVVGIK